MTDEDLSAYYAAAIDVLINYDTDYEAVCVRLAKSDPKKFCEIIGLEPWEIQAVRVYHSEGKIHAIKAIRNATGMGLDESKKTIENLVKKENSE